MGSYAVIAETSETLVDLLRDRIRRRTDAIDVDRNRIALVSPNEIEEDSDIRLSVYLYSIAKNDALNTEPRRYDQDEEVTSEPPLALDLQYLITAYPAGSNGNKTAETIDQHRLLGLAIQTLNDNSILDGSEFGGSRFDKDVSITLQTETTEEAMDIWFNAIGEKPYHLSVAYTVSPVLVDSRAEEEIPSIDERELGYEDKEE
jgi:hypothetical protein